ncbi:hypothetical protein NMG60_11014673 [Bertholletia excelsa]
MQRLTSTNRPSDEHRNFVIDIPPPLQDKRSPRKHVLRFRSIDRWIHIIPLFVLICLFILWWFSHPGDCLSQNFTIDPVLCLSLSLVKCICEAIGIVLGRARLYYYCPLSLSICTHICRRIHMYI